MTHRARLLPFVVLGLLGCRGTPLDPEAVLTGGPRPQVNAVASPSLATARRRLRVLVLPFRHRERAAARAVTEAFVLQLEQTQACEAISHYADDGRRLAELPIWDNRGLDVASLVTLHRKFRVDAVALGTVTQYRPYSPPVLGLRVQVVSTRLGSVLWAAEACFDARHRGVQEMLQEFHRRHLSGDGRDYGWTVLLDSPRHYAQFVTHEVAATLETACRRPTIADRL